MLLAKVSMDIEAKHNKDCIAKWTNEDIKTKLWSIEPLSKMWGIGSHMERNLNKMGIHSIKDLALTSKYLLKDKFGVIGEELWEHANGIDESIISEFHYAPKSHSYSHSQVLFKDYNANNIRLIIAEMVEVLTARLRKHNKQCMVIGFGIGYSKTDGRSFYHSIKLDAPTDNTSEITKVCNLIFDEYYDNSPIRKVSISCGGICSKQGIQLNLFSDYKTIKENEQLERTIDNIKERFGKNSILKASNLLEDSTARERNGKIGGHNAK
jgi:DNA polymerase V